MKPVSTTNHVLRALICAGFCLFAATQYSFATSAEGVPAPGPTPNIGPDLDPTLLPLILPPLPASPSVVDGAKIWTNTGSNFNDNAAWTPSGVPAPGDVAWFQSSLTNLTPNLSSSVNISGLYFNGAGASGYVLSASSALQSFTLTATGTSIGSELGDTTAVAIGAENTAGTNTISAPIILAPTTGSTSTISQATGGTLVISGAISGSAGISKTGGGTLTLTGVDTYTGTTTINSGTLNLNNSNSTTARVANTTNITINSGGTLLLSPSRVVSTDRINNAATMTLNGGTFNTGGLSEHGVNNNTAGIGALTLQSSSIIDMGAGSSVIAFANSSAATWSGTLSIYNWTGNMAGGGTDQLYFGSGNTGLTGTQLSDITFYSDNGITSLGVAQILLDGEIVPVPEPATWFACSLAILGVGGIWFQRARRLSKLTKVAP